MKTPLHKLGVFDLETTGVDIETARIVTAHIGILDADGNALEGKTWVINPGVPIPPEASAVNGLTDDYVAEHGISPREGIAILEAGIDILLTQGIPVVAFNAAFDFTILDREIRRHHHRLPVYDPKPILDPLVIDKATDKFRKGKRTLEAMTAFYGVEFTNAHEADADAIAAGRVMLKLYAELEQNARIDDLTPELLHGWTVIWKRKQAESFTEYLERQGKSAADVHPEWPVVPVRTTGGSES